MSTAQTTSPGSRSSRRDSLAVMAPSADRRGGGATLAGVAVLDGADGVEGVEGVEVIAGPRIGAGW